MKAENLLYVGKTTTEKVGKNSTPKATIFLLQKEAWEKNGQSQVTYKLIPATAWKGMIDNFEAAEPGDLVKEVIFAIDSRVYKGKVYADITIRLVDKNLKKIDLSAETKQAVEDWISKLEDEGVLGTKKAAPKKATEPDDDLPF